MKQQRPLVVSGSIAIDRIMSFDGSYSDHLNPEKLDSVSVSIFIDRLTYNNGGVGANIAYNVALFGDEPYLVGSVGPDGIEYLEWLAKHGVNITHVHESSLPTATFSVITDGQQNQIGGFYPGAMFDSETLSLADWYKSNPVIVVAPHDPKSMRKQVEECVEHDLSLVYDIGQQVSNTSDENLRHGVDAAEILILNEYELSVLAKKIDRTVEDICKNTPLVVTTFGPNGSTLAGKLIGETIHVHAVPGVSAVDPTGAGDAYRGGFLYGYSRGWQLKTCAELGSVNASFAIEIVGTQTHAPSREQLIERYRDTYRKKLTLGD